MSTFFFLRLFGAKNKFTIFSLGFGLQISLARLSNNRDKIFITCNTTKREEVKALEGMGVKKTIAFIVEKKLTCCY